MKVDRLKPHITTFDYKVEKSSPESCPFQQRDIVFDLRDNKPAVVLATQFDDGVFRGEVRTDLNGMTDCSDLRMATIEDLLKAEPNHSWYIFASMDYIELPYVKNYHILKVKYIGPTNSRGSRVKITSDRFQQSVTMNYDNAYNTATDIAAAWLLRNGFTVVGKGEGPSDGHNYIITSTFKPLKPEKK